MTCQSMSRTTKVADGVWLIGDDSPICRIFPKEEQFDSAEAISTEGRTCGA